MNDSPMMTSDGVEGFDSFKGGVHARTGILSGNTLALAKFVAEIVGDPLWSPTYTLSRSRICNFIQNLSVEIQFIPAAPGGHEIE